MTKAAAPEGARPMKRRAKARSIPRAAVWPAVIILALWVILPDPHCEHHWLLGTLTRMAEVLAFGSLGVAWEKTR
jgi:hypothetical protein